MTGEPPPVGEPRKGESPRIQPVGDAALTVELGDAIDPVLNARVRALDRALLRSPFPGFVESIPAFCSLLVVYDPERTSYEQAAGAVRILEDMLESGGSGDEELPPIHEIPVLYGGDAGPDLEAVARRTGLLPDEVIAFHSAGEYTAFVLGFLRGFPYLGLLPERLEVPRLETPRTRVPAGSVGIAGRLTGVYPVSAPAGWNIIGRTSKLFFDPAREPPSLVRPGDRVRFVSVRRLEDEPVTLSGGAATRAPAPAAPSVEVVAPGLFTTVQGAPRRGYRRYGVPAAGPLDEPAHARANAAVGNLPDTASLECTIVGPTLRFLRPTRIAVAGGDLGARLERDDLGSWPVPPERSILARPGNLLSFDGRRTGCRAYVAFDGGIDVPVVLGSRSTDLASGFGGFEGRALAEGDLLSLRTTRENAAHEAPRMRPYAAGTGEEPRAEDEDAIGGPSVRVVLGPQAERFTEDALELFLSTTWDVRVTSDRTGLRLGGPALTHLGPAEIPSDGMLPGSIQVPPDGQPIVMLADGPTTGGYPKIATVVRADLALLAQLVPGASRLRFARSG